MGEEHGGEYERQVVDCAAYMHAEQSAVVPTTLLPPEVSEDAAAPLDVSVQAVWAAAEAVFGGGAGSAAEAVAAAPAGRVAARFQRLWYTVQIGGVQHNLTGLLVEPAVSEHRPIRGIFLYSHGTKAPGDPAVSWLGGPLSDVAALLALVSQLGFAVVAPDDVGLGPSALTSHQAYLRHDVLSTVSIELLRGAMQSLMRTPSRFRPQRKPELWLMGGSHGGYVTAAVQRRLQADPSLCTLHSLVQGAFMHAAPLDVSGSMLSRLASSAPYSKPWYLLLVAKALEVYGGQPSFRAHVLPSFVGVYDAFSLSADGTAWTTEALDAVWSSRGYTLPVDAFTSSYQQQLQDEESMARRSLVAAFESHADLHTGWQPTANVQHLCSGGMDEQVPASISQAAAARWGMQLIIIQDAGHTAGIVECSLVALGNLTSRVVDGSSALTSNATSSSSSYVVEPVMLTPSLLSWARLSVAVWCLVGASSLWLLLSMATLPSTSKQQNDKGRGKGSVTRHDGGGCGGGCGGYGGGIASRLGAHLGRRVAKLSISSSGSGASSRAVGRSSAEQPSCGWRVLGRSYQALLRCLLACPGILALLAFFLVLCALALPLYLTAETILAGGQLFELEIETLRSVNGAPLTDRQDAFDLIRMRLGSLSLEALEREAPEEDAAASRRLGKVAFRPPNGRSHFHGGVEEATGQARRGLQSTRSVTLYYSMRGGRNDTLATGRIHGNVLSLSSLSRMRDIEAKIIELTGSDLVELETVVPCFFGQPLGGGDAPLIARPHEPTEQSVQSCLSRVVGQPDVLTHFSSDFSSSFVGGQAHCSAVRSILRVDASSDLDAWLRAVETIHDDLVEVSWYGDGSLTWSGARVHVHGAPRTSSPRRVALLHAFPSPTPPHHHHVLPPPTPVLATHLPQSSISISFTTRPS